MHSDIMIENINPQNSLLLTVDHHFARTPDGEVWVKAIHDGFFWEKYLSVFDRVYAVVRMKEAGYDEVKGWVLSSYPRVEFIPVTFFRGISEFMARYLRIKKDTREAATLPQITCAIFRLPSNIGFLTLSAFRRTGKPYALEVVTNLADTAFYTHGFFKATAYKVWSRMLKRICLQADGVSYVTEKTIQRNYPPGKQAFTTHYSSIDLSEEYFYKRDASDMPKDAYTLVHVSTLEGLDKGHLIFLETIRLLRKKGYNVKGRIVGGGRYKAHYEAESRKKGLERDVEFVGHLGAREDLRNVLIQSDIFLFPTETEGLPRSVIEAMACSLPCVASTVGGIPELLEADYIADPKDLNRFCAIVEGLIKDKENYRRQSERNYNRARDYRFEVLKERRDAFYKALLAKQSRI